VVAAVLTGLGQGAGFRGGLAMVNLAAPRDRRAEVVSAYFFVGYVALSLPIVGAGLAAERFGLRASGIGFGLGVATIATLAGIASVSRARAAQDDLTLQDAVDDGDDEDDDEDVGAHLGVGRAGADRQAGE
jgi:MFS family permease